jgi:hypothetical protein
MWRALSPSVSLLTTEGFLMIGRTRLQAFTAALLFVAACSDQNQPAAPGDQPELSDQAALQSGSGDPIGLGRKVPGFGGFYLDTRAKPVVYLKGAGQRGNAERALAPFLAAQGLAASELRVLPATFDWDQLELWSTQASGAILALPGAVFVDADESGNRVLVGVERGAAGRIRSAIARLRIPQAAVMIQETEPIRLTATLRNRVRPISGGLQVNFPGFLCTLGFNAIRSGQSSFITNSPCTTNQGGTEGTRYWQPTQTAAAQIGTEASDPMYFSNRSGCPARRRCRFSDAARAAYTGGTPFSLGRIARTSGPNNGSVTINGSFSIAAEGSASVGQTVNKVGRTSGWSQGRLTNRCANVAVTGTNIVQLCQDIASARVGAGDSGSPVFQGTTSATLVGILWGGNSSGTLYVYSPMANIERELGALRTF